MVPSRFYVTPYYWDPVKNDQDKAPLQKDAWACYDLAVSGNHEEAQKIMLDWALGCREVVNGEAHFVMTFKGQLFLESYLMGDPAFWNSKVFSIWVERVYRKSAMKFYQDSDNQASWGILGTILSDLILGKSQEENRNRLWEHIEKSVGSGGVMVEEVKRTNSGIWYSYFSLAPLLRSCQLIDPSMSSLLIRPLNWLFSYCQNPTSWPYKPKTGFLGWWEKLWYPRADTLLLPKKDNWPANLFYEAGVHFNRSEWKNWGTPPWPGVNIFRR